MTTPIIGVLLAAGRSRRMGVNKLTLPWPPSATTRDGQQTVIAATFDVLKTNCTIVVVGHAASDIEAALRGRKAHFVTADSDAPMFESIRSGLKAAREISPAATILLSPGDHPAVSHATRMGIVIAASARPTVAILPTYRGKGGHPIAIPASVCQRVLEHKGEAGLAGFWRSHPQLTHKIEFDDVGIVEDLDMPSDYARSKDVR